MRQQQETDFDGMIQDCKTAFKDFSQKGLTIKAKMALAEKRISELREDFFDLTIGGPCMEERALRKWIELNS